MLLVALYAVPMSATGRFSAAGQTMVISVESIQSNPTTLVFTAVEETATSTMKNLLDDDEDRLVNAEWFGEPKPIVFDDVLHSRQGELPKLAPPIGLPDLPNPARVTIKRRELEQDSPEVSLNERLLPPNRPELQDRQQALAATPIKPVMGVKENESADMTDNPPPIYPREAITLRLQGTVLLRLRIDKTGKVEDVEVIQSSGHRVLDQAAVNAVARWSGKPATRWGRPIESVEVLPLRFRL